MLKRITKEPSEQKQIVDKKLSSPLPSSEKIYIESKKFNDVKVGMRRISLEDKETTSLTVYDTSGPYTDKRYIHDRF